VRIETNYYSVSDGYVGNGVVVCAGERNPDPYVEPRPENRSAALWPMDGRPTRTGHGGGKSARTT